MIVAREYPLAPIAGVGAVLIAQEHVLLIRRGHEPLLGQWSLPGGAIELGETLEQAIRREVLEETGLAVQPVCILKTFDRIDRQPSGQVRFHYVLVDFLCTLPAGMSVAQASSDATEAIWAPIREIRDVKFALPAWTLEVIDSGWQRFQEMRPVRHLEHPNGCTSSTGLAAQKKTSEIRNPWEL